MPSTVAPISNDAMRQQSKLKKRRLPAARQPGIATRPNSAAVHRATSLVNSHEAATAADARPEVVGNAEYDHLGSYQGSAKGDDKYK